MEEKQFKIPQKIMNESSKNKKNKNKLARNSVFSRPSRIPLPVDAKRQKSPTVDSCKEEQDVKNDQSDKEEIRYTQQKSVDIEIKIDSDPTDVGCFEMLETNSNEDSAADFELESPTSPSIIVVESDEDDDVALPPCWTLVKRSLGDDSGFQEEFFIREIEEELKESPETDSEADQSSSTAVTDEEEEEEEEQQKEQRSVDGEASSENNGVDLDILCHVRTLERFREAPDVVLTSGRIYESEVDVGNPAGSASDCLILSHASQVTTVSVVEETVVSLPPAVTPPVSRTEAILATSNMLKACIGQPVLRMAPSTAAAAKIFAAANNVVPDLASDDDLLLRISPEEVTDPLILDKMLNVATNYDQRRKIRAQIRLLRRKHDDLFGPDDGRGGSARRMDMDSTPDIWRTIDTLVASSLNGTHESPSELHGKELTSGAKMADIVNGINLMDINEELKLHEMLDAAQDYEDRKLIRCRLKDVIAQSRAQREEMIRRREEEREELIRGRLRDADEQKRRTLAMYDAMAKSAPAGGNKTIDVSILRDGHSSGASTPTKGGPVGGPRQDLVEDSIRQRQRDADDRKKRILTAYDTAAKSGPAGAPRFIDFEAVKSEEVANYYQPKPKPSSTFTMSGGIPIPCKPGTNVNLASPREVPHDSVEEAIRRRQREADERKRRTLDAYDQAARSRPAGEPVSVYIPQDDSIAPVIESSKRMSPRQKFQQLDTSVAPKGVTPTVGAPKAGPGVVRSPTAIKEMLLNWCKSKTKEYENVSIDNFSTSWNDGMAFCALIHHFYPDAFDFNSLNPKNRRFNFDLAFRVAEEKGDVAPLLETDDMVMMKKPDWKCVFCYVQSLYRRFHNVD